MPDFGADLLAGYSVQPWTDPATGLVASRLNDISARPRFYKKVDRPISPAVVNLVLEATVGGVLAPADAALGGRLFIASWVQWSGAAAPPLSQPVAGFSSIVHVQIQSIHAGYFAVLFWRPAGGSLVVPFNVE